ncbi:MAG: T9SS type A sorting domain-containing protein [Saprospiraceae bacterium]
MRRTFTSIILIAFSFLVQAQNFRFKSDESPCKTTFITDPLSPTDWPCHNLIRNQSAGLLYLLWKREDVTVPLEWEPTVCDNVNCYYTLIKRCPVENINEIVKGGSMLADVHVYDAGVPGSAYVRLEVYERDDTTSKISIDYLFNKESVGTNSIRNISLRMYPNPATNTFNVDYNTGINRIELYSILGTKIQSFNTEPSKSYDISNLEDGIYLVKFITTEGRVLKTLRLQKKGTRS